MLILVTIFRVIDAYAIGISLKIYGAPRFRLYVAMVTHYFRPAIHFKEILKGTCQTKIQLRSVKSIKKSVVK